MAPRFVNRITNSLFKALSKQINTHKFYLYNDEVDDDTKRWNKKYYSKVLHTHQTSHTHTPTPPLQIYATEVFNQDKWTERMNRLASVSQNRRSADTLKWSRSQRTNFAFSIFIHTLTSPHSTPHLFIVSVVRLRWIEFKRMKKKQNQFFPGTFNVPIRIQS